MSLENDELDEAFGSDEPEKVEASGDEIDAAFSGETKSSETKPFDYISPYRAAADVALSTARGMVNKPAASLSGAAAAVQGLMYGKTNIAENYRQGREAERAAIDRGEGLVQPEGLKTEEGKALAETLARGGKWIGDKIHVNPFGDTTLNEAVQGAGDVAERVGGPELRDFASSAAELALLKSPEAFGLKKFSKPPKVGALSETGAMADAQSMGAARASLDVADASPELKAEFAKIDPKDIDPRVAQNHLKADSLPVKMRLTEGQATGDPDIITDEMNTRGATGLSQDLNLQGQQLKANIQAIRDEVGPDVFSTNEVEHGDALINAYKAKDAPILQDIEAKYKALEDANGGRFPVDGPQLLADATNQLHKGLLYEHAPPAVMKQLERFAKSNDMTFEHFEALRTNLARVMRTATDGNERAAAGVIRSAMENLPLQAGAENLKPLADAARSASKARFTALEADPAYKAAVTDAVPPDRFVEKFVTGKSATRDNVARMRAALIKDPVALQTMGVATVDALRDAAGIDRAGNGIFKQARYNKRLEGLDPKLQSLLPADQAEHARNLGDVARLIKEQPEGSAVNNSGTLTGAIAQFGGKLAEGVLNAKTGGLSGQIIEHLRGKASAKGLSDKRAKATAPLAGVRRKPGTPAKPTP